MKEEYVHACIQEFLVMAKLLVLCLSMIFLEILCVVFLYNRLRVG